MNRRGVPDDASTGDLLVRSRSAMLDALAALADHRDAVIVIGAQAVYLRTSSAPVALAEATKDSDLAIDPRTLGEDPRVEAAMKAAGFMPDPIHGQPGAWVNAMGIPVDLMVPETLAGPGGSSTRGARIPPHDRRAMRRARGLEAAVVDNTIERVCGLGPADRRVYDARVAGPAALLVAKTHKIAERIETPRRLNDKDAHDMYRILIAVETEPLVEGFRRLLAEPVSAPVTDQALTQMSELVAAGPQAPIPMMAGRAEEGLGDPETVALSTSLLAKDLLAEFHRP
jgi:hypothetical protein